MPWSDIDDKRARVVVLQQMRAAMGREKKTPRLSASLRRQVDPEWEESEAEDAVEEAVDDSATEAGSDVEEEEPLAEGEPPEPEPEPPEPEEPPDSPPPPRMM